MLKHFRQNLGYRILSVVLAIVIWIYVTGEQKPTGETVIRVPLEIENLSEDLVVSDSPSSIQVRLEGRKAVVSNLIPRDVHARVNMINAKTGENIIPVEVEVPDGVNVISVKPSQIKIKVEKMEYTQVQVQVSLVGEPASGYRVLEPVIKPTEVVISGPAGLLKEIGGAYVEAEIDQASGNYLAYLPVRLRDKEGHPLSQWLEINPPVVETFVPVVQDMPSKILSIQARLEGEPAGGYAIRRVILQPSVVEVFAPYEQLKELNYISTAPINISGARREVVRETNLDIPPGVQVSIFPRVRVIVEVVQESTS